MISEQKTIPIIATIDAQDKDEIAISADDDEVTLPENEIQNLFQDTFSEEKLETQ